MIKLFLLSMSMLLASFSFAQDKQFLYSENLEQALEKASDSNKNVLLIFSGTDWCRPCMILDQTVLSQTKFIGFANQNLEIYKT